MGRKFDDDEVAAAPADVPVRDRRAPTTATRTSACAAATTRRRRSRAIVLQKMRQTAEDWLGEQVTEAVITVPGVLRRRPAPGDQGRRPHRRASTCCASSTSRPRPRSRTASRPRRAQRVAVYDLGGGTFDISILELDDGVFRVRSTAGDTFLGGEDFDNAIVEHLLADVRRARTTGMDLRGDRMALQRLKEAAERAKIELSSAFADRDQPAVHRGRRRRPAPPADHARARRSSRRWSSRSSQATLEPCRRALADAGLTAERHRRRDPRRRPDPHAAGPAAGRRDVRQGGEPRGSTPTRSSRSARRSRPACSPARCRRSCCSTSRRCRSASRPRAACSRA